MTKYVAIVLFYGQILGAIYKVGQKTAQTDGKKQFAEWLEAEQFEDTKYPPPDSPTSKLMEFNTPK